MKIHRLHTYVDVWWTHHLHTRRLVLTVLGAAPESPPLPLPPSLSPSLSPSRPPSIALSVFHFPPPRSHRLVR